MDNEIGQVNTVANNSTPVQSAALDFLLGDEAVSSAKRDTRKLIDIAEENFETTKKGAAATRDFQKGRAMEEFEINADTLTRQGSAARLGMRESRGLASSMAQFQIFDDTINKQMNQLERNKSDALRAADMDFYTRISDAQMNLINTQIQATNSMYERLFGIAGISQQQQQIQLSQRAQEFTEQSQMGGIALEFGLDLQPGETMQGLITRAMPRADEKRQLELKQIQSQIAYTQAQTAEIGRARQSAERMKSYLNGLSEDQKKTLLVAGKITAEDLIEAGDTNGLAVLAKAEKNNMYNLAGRDVAEMYSGNNSKKDIIDTIVASYPALTQADAGLIYEATIAGGARGGSSNKNTLGNDVARLGTTFGNIGTNLGEYYGLYSNETAEKTRGSLFGQ